MSSGMIPGAATILGQLIAPSGTRMPLHQAAVPLGWTQDTSTAMSDTSLRVNNNSPSTGGTTAWSSWNFGGTFNVNSFTLTVAQMPTHNHSFTNNPSHTHTTAQGGVGQFYIAVSSGAFAGTASSSIDHGIQFTATNSDSANISLASVGSGASITPTYTTPQVQYIDLIMAVKS